MNKVYSRDFGGGLTEHFSGTRSQCQTWINNMTKAGRPTHFYFITTLDYRKAKEKYGTK